MSALSSERQLHATAGHEHAKRKEERNMQHKEDIEVKTPEADGEAAPVDWKLARSLVEPLIWIKSFTPENPDWPMPMAWLKF